jgi:hypothetical protein
MLSYEGGIASEAKKIVYHVISNILQRLSPRHLDLGSIHTLSVILRIAAPGISIIRCKLPYDRDPPVRDKIVDSTLVAHVEKDLGDFFKLRNKDS